MDVEIACLGGKKPSDEYSMAGGNGSIDGRTRNGWLSMDPIDKSSAQAVSSIIITILEVRSLLLLVLVVSPPRVARLLIGKIGFVATPLTGALELDFSDIESWEDDALLQVELPLLGPSPLRFILVVWGEQGDDDRDCIPIPE